MEAARRILKKTCRQMGYMATGEVTFFDIEEYHVQKQVITVAVFEDAHKIEWVTENYSIGIGEQRPAIFYNKDEALLYIKGLFGKETEEVVWTNAK